MGSVLDLLGDHPALVGVDEDSGSEAIAWLETKAHLGEYRGGREEQVVLAVGSLKADDDHRQLAFPRDLGDG